MWYRVMFLSLFVLVSCKDNLTEPRPPYDSMLFVRAAGGAKAFNVYQTASTDTFNIIVTQFYEYRDTSIAFIAVKDAASAASFNALTQTFQGQTQLFGDYTPDTLPTGTRSYVYMIKGGQQIEITNTSLRNLLSYFENIVKAKIIL